MFVIRLPNGNLQVPQTAIHTGDGRLIGDVYVEIGPEDTEYARLAEHALTPDEVEERKLQWRAGDAALLREFQEFARLVGDDLFHPDDRDLELASPGGRAERGRGPLAGPGIRRRPRMALKWPGVPRSAARPAKSPR
jgi:hypothetical protein